MKGLFKDLHAIFKRRDWSMLAEYVFKRLFCGVVFLALFPIWLPAIIFMVLADTLKPLAKMIVWPVGAILDLNERWHQGMAKRFNDRLLARDKDA